MNAEQFTRNVDVREQIQKIRRHWNNRAVSDVIDESGNQYVDLVMEGGGVLGIALLGYTYALEEAGIRFMGIGGTSAGSITALLLAALDTRDKAKSQELVVRLANQDLNDFVDGDSDARDFIRAALNDAGAIKLGLKGLQVIDNLTRDLGLNPGDVFLKWISSILQEKGITNSRQLMDRISWMPPGIRHRNGEPIPQGGLEGKLAIVAAEVTTETKVEFPRMAPLFWEHPDEIDPALFVRASMSIPFFFHPFRVKNVPRGDAAFDNWEKLASYTGELPDSAILVDGGIMSNFPIDLFHKSYRVPKAPTLGVKLGTDRRSPHRIEKPMQLLGSVFNSARHALDYDFITRNPDYRHLVTCIDTKEHDWLNFDLSDEAKVDLFASGVRAATEFLFQFDWEEYKRVREHLAKAHLVSDRDKIQPAVGDGHVVTMQPAVTQ